MGKGARSALPLPLPLPLPLDLPLDLHLQGERHAALPPPPPPPIGAELPRWAVEGEERKRGAGVLFFAYGGRQLEHFLSEATTP